jgi:hypothetical protein
MDASGIEAAIRGMPDVLRALLGGDAIVTATSK